MLKKGILFLAILGLIVSVSSCKKDEESPTANFLGGAGFVTTDQTVTAGESVKVGVTAAAPAGFTKMTIRVAYDGGVATTVKDSSISGENFTLSEYTIKTRSAVGTEKWEFSFVDKNDNSASLSITLTTTGGPIVSYTAKLMGAQLATAGSFMATSNGTVYTIANAKTNSNLIDFCYFFDPAAGGNAATIAAPSSALAASFFSGATNGIATWTTRNATKLGITTLTAADFNAINNWAAFSQTPTADLVGNLKVGDVFAFTTAAGKKGLAKVNAINTGNTGDITIDVKVAP